MSKPREFWVDPDAAFCCVHDAFSEEMEESPEYIHVIEKSAADKLALALDKINDDCAEAGYKYNQVEYDMVQTARKALEEYRSGFKKS